jgi:hypothetical protein
MVNRNNWETRTLTQSRQDLAIPGEWGRSAGHHKISKEHLEWLSIALDESLKSRDMPIKNAALAFWKATQDVIPEPVKKDLGSAGRAKWLWNIPVNIEVGPADIAENPGQNFDPNSQPTNTGRAGARQLTPESGNLKSLEDIFLSILRTDRSQLPTAEQWTAMGGQLKQAQNRHLAYLQQQGSEGLLAPPRVEQWLPPADGKFQRKRDRTFLTAADGRSKFRDQAANSASHDVAEIEQDWPLQVDHTHLVVRADDTEEDHTVHLTMPADVLEHVCLRHTYAYFARTPDEVKLVNNFWPTDVVSTPDGYLELIKQALPDIARITLESMDAANLLDDMDGMLEIVNAPVGDEGSRRVLFFAAKFTRHAVDDQPTDTEWDVTLTSVAPDGNSAETYPADVLTAIMHG